MADNYDVVVIGGGSGGYVAAIRLAQYGRSVAVVERDKLGGTCLHRGCIPTKAILESAGLYERMRHAADFGISASDVSYDYGEIAARKDKIVSANEQGIRGLFRANGIDSIAGQAALMEPGVIEVTDGEGTRRLQAADVLLAVGSRPKSLPGLEIDGTHVVTSDHVTAWTELPKSIVIVGAGAVGAEFASAMSDLGVEVTLVEFLPRVLPREDTEIGDVVAKSFARRGMTILTNAGVRPETLKRESDGIRVEVEMNGERRSLAAEKLLVATSREPVLDGWGQERAGIRVDRGFVAVDAQMRTSQEHVYACGDLVGGLMLAHAAFAEGLAAAAAIAGQKAAPVDYVGMPRVTYTRPEVASVGITEEEARAAGHSVQVGRFSFRANAKAMITGEAEGLVKTVADEQTGEILGVHMVGPHAGELIAEGTLARFLESTPLEVALTVHAHPTLAEAFAESAGEALGIAIHSHRPRRAAG